MSNMSDTISCIAQAARGHSLKHGNIAPYFGSPESMSLVGLPILGGLQQNFGSVYTPAAIGDSSDNESDGDTSIASTVRASGSENDNITQKSTVFVSDNEGKKIPGEDLDDKETGGNSQDGITPTGIAHLGDDNSCGYSIRPDIIRIYR